MNRVKTHGTEGSKRYMYAWIWRHLPGSLWVRLLWVLVMFAIAVFLLFQYIFPWLEPHLPFSGNGSLSQ